MNNTLWHPASEPPRERTQPLLLATKTTWRDKDGKMLQGISPTAYFLGCYADGQFWDAKTLSKHGTNATKRIEYGQKTRQLYIPTILL